MLERISTPYDIISEEVEKDRSTNTEKLEILRVSHIQYIMVGGVGPKG